MRIFHNIYHFLLFLFVSWTVYNTFIFVCFLLPASKNEFAVLTIIDFWNFYLLGALDFHAFTRDLNDIFINCLDPWSLRKFWPFYLYSFAMTGIALYIWCATQNPFSACFLAIVHCIAGPYLILLFKDYSILFWGAIGTIVFYIFLYKLNKYRKKHFPSLTLPAWLEWRRPNMVPSITPITDWITHEFNKYKLPS